MGVQPPVYGVAVDAQTRCAHYRQDFDVVAIKHFCCQKYFCCHLCHDELADHPTQVWPKHRFDDEAILCGVCRHELSVTNYLATDACPRCTTRFNPGCKLHAGLYFTVSVTEYDAK